MDVADRVASVRERITAAASRAGRDPASVRLVAVTKGVEAAAIREVIAAGVRDLGENRVPEAVRKREELPKGLTWHMVGHVQSNKASRVAAVFDVVHSIDSASIAAHLGARRDPERDPIAGLLEVDLTGIAQRTGTRADGIEDVVRSAAGVVGMHLVGLMTIAPQGGPERARECFATLRALRDRAATATGWPLPELSMGMSDDYEVAVEEGATLVRVGRAIFAGAD